MFDPNSVLCPGAFAPEPVPLSWGEWAHRPELQVPLMGAGLILVLLLVLRLPEILAWNRARKGGTLRPGEVEQLMIGTPPVIVDLRPASQFNGPKGHLRGAHNIPIQQLASRLQELVQDRRGLVVLVDGSDALSHRAAPILQAQGYPWVRVLRGGMRAWGAKHLPVSVSGRQG